MYFDEMLEENNIYEALGYEESFVFSEAYYEDFSEDCGEDNDDDYTSLIEIDEDGYARVL